MFRQFAYSRLRHAEVLQQHTDVLNLIRKADPVALGIATQTDAFATIVGQMEASFKQERASSLSAELADLDEKRDDMLLGISGVAKSYTYHFNPARVQQGNALLASMNHYGSDLVRQNYQSETAGIHNLLNDWKTKPHLTTALHDLHLTEWQDELVATNAKFSVKFVERAAIEGQAATLPSFKSLREPTMKSWKKVMMAIGGLCAFYENDPVKSAPYLSLVNSINGILANYEQLLAARAGRAAAKVEVNEDTSKQ